VASKELTSLLLDEERLRAERSDRKTWKSRVTGLEEEYAPHHSESSERPARRQPRRQYTDEEDAEYKLALEASKYQEEEDRRKRESRNGLPDDDADLAKALKLSKEEEERRRRELETENQNADDLFGTGDLLQEPQPTGYNQGYQQGNAVDWLANPIDQHQQQQQQPQQTGFTNMASAYTGYQTQPQPTGYNGFSNGYGTQNLQYDPFGAAQMQQPVPNFQPQPQPQPTGYNPYSTAQVPSPLQQQPTIQAGSNNPWSTNSSSSLNNPMTGMQPLQTGSNNPFAQQQSQQSFSRPQAFKAPTMSALPEQKTLTTFSQASPSPFGQQRTATQQPPQNEMSDYQQRLGALLSSGEGQDTFGNTGNTRIPAQHTAPAPFVNSAGANLSRVTAEATGNTNNPYIRSQFTGMPAAAYQQMPAATGPANLGLGAYGAMGSSNPFGTQLQPQQQQQQQTHNNQGGNNLIDL
jgi:epsin